MRLKNKTTLYYISIISCDILYTNFIQVNITIKYFKKIKNSIDYQDINNVLSNQIKLH